MDKTLTVRQRDVLKMIREYVQEFAISPTLQEIGDRFGVNKASVTEHVQALSRKGYVTVIRHIARGIRLVDGTPCPCCGRPMETAAAG